MSQEQGGRRYDPAAQYGVVRAQGGAQGLDGSSHPWLRHRAPLPARWPPGPPPSSRALLAAASLQLLPAAWLSPAQPEQQGFPFTAAACLSFPRLLTSHAGRQRLLHASPLLQAAPLPLPLPLPHLHHPHLPSAVPTTSAHVALAKCLGAPLNAMHIWTADQAGRQSQAACRNQAPQTALLGIAPKHCCDTPSSSSSSPSPPAAPRSCLLTAASKPRSSSSCACHFSMIVCLCPRPHCSTTHS